MKKKILLFIFLIYQSYALASEIRIVDGDTIVLNGEKIRFFGIDAPEIDQECVKNGKVIMCGEVSKKALKDKIGNKKPICIKLIFFSLELFVFGVCGAIDIN